MGKANELKDETVCMICKNVIAKYTDSFFRDGHYCEECAKDDGLGLMDQWLNNCKKTLGNATKEDLIIECKALKNEYRLLQQIIDESASAV